MYNIRNGYDLFCNITKLAGNVGRNRILYGSSGWIHHLCHQQLQGIERNQTGKEEAKKEMIINYDPNTTRGYNYKCSRCKGKCQYLINNKCKNCFEKSRSTKKKSKSTRL